MTLRFEQILTEGIAQLSYLVGDDAAGTAAVVDPRPDVGIYLERARRHGLSISHVLETHIHADFMSGARQLVERLGGTAELCVSAEGGADYGFEHRPLRDGEVIELGSVVLTARFTPDHTPEHLSYLLAEKDRAAGRAGRAGAAAAHLRRGGQPRPGAARRHARHAGLRRRPHRGGAQHRGAAGAVGLGRLDAGPGAPDSARARARFGPRAGGGAALADRAGPVRGLPRGRHDGLARRRAADAPARADDGAGAA